MAAEFLYKLIEFYVVALSYIYINTHTLLSITPNLFQTKRN